MKKLLILMLLLFPVTSVIFAQVPPAGVGAGARPGMNAAAKNGKITGKIIDSETKEPMEYANVSVFRKQDSKLVTGSITNVSGAFVIADLPYGAYYVEASFIGFDKTTVNDIKLIPTATTADVGTISLAASREQISTVDVVAERSRVEYKIDKKVINVTNDINASGGTAVTVLENTPSVEVDIDGNVSLRGSSSFTVLIDGRPSVLTGSDALKQIPSSAIQNIEIITNPSVKYDPDGMAGIINIVMKKNVLAGINGIMNVNLGTGDKYGTDLTLNYKTKKYNVFFGGNWNDNTDWGKMRSTRETYSNDTTTYLLTSGTRNMSRGGTQIRGGLDYYLSDKTTVTVSSEVGNYNFDSYGTGNLHNYNLPSSFDTYSLQKNNTGRNGNFVSANVNFQTKFNELGTHKLEGSFNYRNRDGKTDETVDENLSDAQYQTMGEYISRVITHENSNSNDYRAKLDYTLPFKNGAKYEAGLQTRIEDEQEDLDFKSFNVTTQQFENNPMFTSNMDFKEQIHSAYSTYTGSLVGIQYVAGLRGEYNKREITHYKENVPNTYKLDQFDYFPSLHLSYELADHSQLMTSYSKRINRPDGRDLDPFPSYMNKYTIRTGNPALKPEYTDSYELSYMKKFGGSFLSFETFYRTTNNLITRLTNVVDDISYMTVGNMNRDYSLGGEIMGNINVTKWLLINTSFSLYDYKLKGDVLGESVDKESTNYSGRLNATVKFSTESRFQLSGFYRGPSVSAQGTQKGSVFTNLSYRQDFMKKKLTATVSVRDLLGTMRMQGTSSGDNFSSTFKMTREPRVVMLTLSYKINNYKIDRSAPEERSESNEDLF
jgi:outer membrane receptor protein involved in Fe transport